MRSYNVSKELFDEAVYKEYRILERFFDIGEALDFKECSKVLWFKISNNVATKEELLRVANLIKQHCE